MKTETQAAKKELFRGEWQDKGEGWSRQVVGVKGVKRVRELL